MATIRDPDNVPRRLVKLYLPVETVRKMDAAILRSVGGYFDRAEFVNEALIDRLAEENHGAVEPLSLQQDRKPTPLVAVPEPNFEFAPDIVESVGLFGDWLSNGAVPTLPPAAGHEANFGLHNRDYPTIWACDQLGRMTTEAGAAIRWETLSEQLLHSSWAVGRRLAVDDAESGRPVKAGVGFPTNPAKKEAAERRFLAHSFGLPTARGNPGPVFVFRWVGVERAEGKRHIALTDAGVALLRALAKTGDSGPPFGLSAWRTFVDHLGEHASGELRAWLSVLELLREQPNRTELVERCNAWWRGNEAATNAMSYVSRGREWGLVEAKLSPDNRYALTERGAAELDRLKPVLTEGEAS
jgi:DNA-binding PadR family transcriptional regulator